MTAYLFGILFAPCAAFPSPPAPLPGAEGEKIWAGALFPEERGVVDGEREDEQEMGTRWERGERAAVAAYGGKRR